VELILYSPHTPSQHGKILRIIFKLLYIIWVKFGVNALILLVLEFGGTALDISHFNLQTRVADSM
jgi:hypothetical protein